MFISSAVNYVRENPLFVAGCVVSAATSPMFFTGATVCGAVIGLLTADEHKGQPEIGSNGRLKSNNEIVVNRFSYFNRGISGAISLACATVSKVQALVPLHHMARMGGKAFGAFNGIMLGTELMYALSKLD